MKSVIGNNLIYSLFGESHGELIGITIHNIPSKLRIDFDKINSDLKRRKPNKTLSNARIEEDDYEIISGYFDGFTTGAPLTIIVKNKNINSSNYQKGLIRPSHSDLPAYILTDGKNDYRGGGHFSGRLTVLLVICGSICKQILNKNNIYVGSHIKSIGNVEENITNDNFNNLFNDNKTLNDDTFNKIEKLIKETKEKKDSLGGVIEAVVTGLPIGVGEPFFDSLESVISHYLFSIPGCKGVTFGSCLDMVKGNGSTFNDEIYLDNGNIKFKTNHNGGINGGLSNGNYINICTYFKPTPTISLPQNTIDLEKNTNIVYEFKGNHDCAYVLRCDVIVEACVSMAILDLYLDYIKFKSINY